MDALSNTLCHYTTAEAAFQHIIPFGQLRMSPYARMRDPLENRELSFAADGSGDAAEKQTLTNKVIESIRRIRDATRLLSFTIDAESGYSEADRPFMRAWARARMWEQYASSHAGVCIVFDREQAGDHMLGRLHQFGLVGHGEVVYTPRGFADTQASTLLLDQFRESYSRNIGAFVTKHERDLFFTKTLDWQSEHEYRMTLMTDRTGDDGYIYLPFGDARSVRAVILGEQFPEWQFPAAKWACDQVGVELLTLRWEIGLPWPMPTS